MNKKMFSAILGISLIAIVMSVSYSLTEENIQTTSNGYMLTDSSEFTNPYFNESNHASYTTVDPFELKSIAQYTATGRVISAEYVEHDNSDLGVDENGQEIEPTDDFTLYTLQVESTGKTDVKQDVIEIKSYFPTKIGFEKGDEMFVMFEDHQGVYLTMSGPHGFFKIVEDKDNQVQAIGHEITLSERFIDELKR